jgi:hypothetical protein
MAKGEGTIDALIELSGHRELFLCLYVPSQIMVSTHSPQAGDFLPPLFVG